MCRELALFGGDRVAVDGSFFKGNVSSKSFVTVEGKYRNLLTLSVKSSIGQDILIHPTPREAGQRQIVVIVGRSRGVCLLMQENKLIGKIRLEKNYKNSIGGACPMKRHFRDSIDTLKTATVW